MKQSYVLEEYKCGFQDLVPSLFCNNHCNGNFQVIGRFPLKWVPIPKNMSCFKLLIFQFLFNKSAKDTKGCMNHYNLVAPIMHIPKTCSMATKTLTDQVYVFHKHINASNDKTSKGKTI
jgi:hypothetical protein